MSTNYTSHYNLCQWEPNDPVLRTDFNADNAKLDAALKSQSTQLAQALKKSDAAYSPQFQPVVVGTYTGNTVPSQKITLNFRPRAVIAMLLTGEVHFTDAGDRLIRIAAALDGVPGGNTGFPAVEIENDGFRVYLSIETGGKVQYQMNLPNRQYVYFAFR